MTHTSPPKNAAPKMFRLRLLQTTDLHMHLLPFEYSTMQPSTQHGLANLASQISSFRADDVPTLLFDTGDFLQGSPLADMAAKGAADNIHPIAKTFNALRYDAVALGNHDFDYGLCTLERVIDQIKCPVLSANVTPNNANAPYAATTLIPVALDPATSIQVGVIGLTTPVIALMNDSGDNTLSTTDPVLAAQDAIKTLKQQGADIIIALCHFGIDPDDHIENVAADIAGLPGIDVVMAGHTHETFPTGTHHKGDMINADAGTIHDTPTVMAGAFGQWLGVVDLSIATDTFTVTDHSVDLIKPQPTQTKNADVFSDITPLHDKALAHMEAVIAQTTLPFSTIFSLIQPDLTQYLLSCARQLHMQAMLVDTPFADLPLLSTAAPFRTGSRAHRDEFIAIPAGPITRSDVAAIYPFNNTAVALRRNGAQIKDWLEASALLFLPITPGETRQCLIDPKIPPYRFDTIFGLTYTIDLTQNPGHKIKSLAYRGKPVTEDDVFILVTSTNRLNQGQNIPPKDIICLATLGSQEILIESLERQTPVTVPCPLVWGFAPIVNTAAQFTTSIDADATDSVRHLTDDGVTGKGSRQFTLHFDD